MAPCTLVEPMSPPAENETLLAAIDPAPAETSTSTHAVPSDRIKSGGARVLNGALPVVIVPPLATTK